MEGMHGWGSPSRSYKPEKTVQTWYVPTIVTIHWFQRIKEQGLWFVSFLATFPATF
jgi:hypothetical protein